MNDEELTKKFFEGTIYKQTKIIQTKIKKTKKSFFRKQTTTNRHTKRRIHIISK